MDQVKSGSRKLLMERNSVKRQFPVSRGSFPFIIPMSSLGQLPGVSFIKGI